jgi:hypothetical protein
MSDFSHLQKYNIPTGKTAEYPLYDIEQEKTPVLIVKHAGDTNKGYMNQVIKETRKKSRNKNLSHKTLEQSRKQDKDLYPKYVVVGWENVLDKDGNEAPFNGENCHAFLDALPDFMFDELRVFAADISSFMDDDIETTDEELGES